MANPTITEKFRASMGGKAWRTYEITHTGVASDSKVTAASMGLDHIECVIGVCTNVSIIAEAASIVGQMTDISISANHDSIVWVASTAVGYQTVTVVGW